MTEQDNIPYFNAKRRCKIVLQKHIDDIVGYKKELQERLNKINLRSIWILNKKEFLADSAEMLEIKCCLKRIIF